MRQSWEQGRSRQDHWLRLQGKAAGALEKEWERLAPRFLTLQAAISEAKMLASKLCKPMTLEAQVWAPRGSHCPSPCLTHFQTASWVLGRFGDPT